MGIVGCDICGLLIFMLNHGSDKTVCAAAYAFPEFFLNYDFLIPLCVPYFGLTTCSQFCICDIHCYFRIYLGASAARSIRRPAFVEFPTA